MEFNETDIFWDKDFTQFWDRTAFWAELDKDVDRFKEDLSKQSWEQEEIDTKIGAEQSAIIKGNNAKQKQALEDSKGEIDKVNSEFKDNTTKRRAQAEWLVDNQRKAAGLQANIAAAKANQWGRLSVGQLTSINTDITNQFTQSLNSAIKDNINFQTDLDSKLSDMGFSAIDKKRLVDEFTKVLVDEEAQPLLDAIATKYTTRKEFMKALSDTLNGIHKAQIKDSSADIQRSEGIERDTNAFNAMTNEEKAKDIRDRFWNTWNVLTRDQKQVYINNVVSWETSYGEMLDIISNLKDQSTQNKQERLATLGSSSNTSLTEWILDNSSVKGFNEWTSTTKDRNFTGASTASKKNPEPVKTTTTRPKSTPKSTVTPEPEVDTKATGYKVGSITYKSEDAYKKVQTFLPSLRVLRTSDPVKYKQAQDLIKKNYLIS